MYIFFKVEQKTIIIIIIIIIIITIIIINMAVQTGRQTVTSRSID